MNLRKLIVDNREDIKRLMLSDAQTALYLHVKINGHVWSNGAAEFFKCSVESASNRLRALFELGYLDRRLSADPTGGYTHEYSLSKLI